MCTRAVYLGPEDTVITVRSMDWFNDMGSNLYAFPLGITTPGRPNISSTIWRSVSDHKNKRYFFESTRNPSLFWVDLADMDFTAGGPTKKLTLTDGAIFAGNTSELFQACEPLRFLPAEAV